MFKERLNEGRNECRLMRQSSGFPIPALSDLDEERLFSGGCRMETENRVSTLQGELSMKVSANGKNSNGRYGRLLKSCGQKADMF